MLYITIISATLLNTVHPGRNCTRMCATYDCVYKFNGKADLHSLALIRCQVSNKQAKVMEKPIVESENVELGVGVKTGSCVPHP